MMNSNRFLTLVALLGAIACTQSKAEDSPATVATGEKASPPPATVSAAPAAIPLKVYKDPNCGCCVEWVKHLERNGFTVESVDLPDMSLVKQKHGVTRELRSCHTAVVGDYVVEGHVPADVIMKMLREKPAIAGLAVPGMPIGSPGMEGAIKERYDILTFDSAGRTTVYAQR